MGEFETASWERSDHADAAAGPFAANVTGGTYNPNGGIRVQLAWQRFSNSPRQHASRPYGRPAGPVRPARPAACR